MICNKKNMLLFLSIIFFFSDILGEKQSLYFTESMGQTQLHDEDKILEEVYRSFSRLYGKLVELAALYCTGSSKVLQDRIVIELGRDVMVIVKSLALYIPVLVKNPKLSKKTKFKKTLCVGGVITVLGFLMKELYQGFCIREKGCVMQGIGRNRLSGQEYYDFDNYNNAFYNYSPGGHRPSVPEYRM